MTLSTQDIKKATAILNELLASTYVLAVKLQNFHWNVEDSRFIMLHAFFEEQYQELLKAIDDIAERIRILGHPVDGSMNNFLKISHLKEVKTIHNGTSMLKSLLKDHETIIQFLHKGMQNLPSKDQANLDMLVGRLHAHEKMAWIVRSHLS